MLTTTELVEQLELVTKLRWAALGVSVLSLVGIQIRTGLAVSFAATTLLVVFVLLYNLSAELYIRVLRGREGPSVRKRAKQALIVLALLDFAALFGGIYYTGGIGSPYLFLLLIYIVSASIVFSASVGFLFATAASVLVIVADLLGASLPLNTFAFVPISSFAYFGSVEFWEPIIWLLFSTMSYLGVYVVSHITTRLKREQQEVGRLMREQDRTVSRLAALQQIGTEVSSLADLSTVLDLIVRKARDLFSTDMAFLALQEGEGLHITVTHGEDARSALGLVLKPGQGLGGLVMLTGQPKIVLDYATDPSLKERPSVILDRVPLKSGVAAPLAVGQRGIGVLYVFNREATHFDSHDAEMLLALANQAAIAIENSRLYTDLREAALVDSLTGLYNSRYLRERLQSEIARVDRYGGKLALIMADCDSLKEVNDRFGHQIGDRLLIQLGRILIENVRESDIVARYGGDEMAILLPEADLPDARDVAERMRRTIEGASMEANGVQIGATVSFGVAAYSTGIMDAEALIREADGALYLAKNTGRNRVCAASLDCS